MVDYYEGEGSSEISYSSKNTSVTHSLSATATGNTYDNALTALTESLNSCITQYTKYNNIKIFKVKYYNFNVVKVKTSNLQLYYELIYVDNKIINQQVLDFIPYIQEESDFSGLTNQYMTDSFGNPNKNIINFIGYRTPENKTLNLPALYNETISILMEDTSYISAQKIYIDSGTSFASTLPYMLYDVTTCSGLFENYKFIKIIFDNTNPKLYKRTVQFLTCKCEY